MASMTRVPFVMRSNAFSTQLIVPPFLNRIPLKSEITTGLISVGISTVGAEDAVLVLEAAAATPVAKPAFKNSRRYMRVIPSFGPRV